MRLPSSVAVLVASIAQAHAQFLVTDLSFGYGVRFVAAEPADAPSFKFFLGAQLT